MVLLHAARHAYHGIGRINICIGGWPTQTQSQKAQVQRFFERTMATLTTTTAAESDGARANNSVYVFDPPLATSLPVNAGTAASAAGATSPLMFPVRRVYCVGKNYADHVVEMGGDLKKSEPVFFTKPSFDGVVYAGPPRHGSESSDGDDGGNTGASTTSIRYPPGTTNLHYEAELVVAIGKEVPCRRDDDDGRRQGGEEPLDAMIPDCVYGYAVGIDLTRRDLQGEAKKGGKPWDTGKYFDQSAPIGPIRIRNDDDDDDDKLSIYDKTIALTVNGETKQSARLGEMIWKIDEIIDSLTRLYTLQPGDLIMTGTPSGVGPVVVGDRIKVTIDGLVEGVDITLV